MIATAPAPPTVRLVGQLAEVTFDRFDLATYELFLACKKLPESELTYSWERDAYTLTTPARYASRLGVVGVPEPPARLPYPDHPFDYQRYVLDQALDAKRYAVWLDTGLGKTVVLLEWCRQVAHATGARVLILVPTNELIDQHREAAAHFYGDALPIARLETRAALLAWCAEPGGAGIGIAIYAKFIPGVIPELRHLAALAAASGLSQRDVRYWLPRLPADLAPAEVAAKLRRIAAIREPEPGALLTSGMSVRSRQGVPWSAARRARFEATRRRKGRKGR